MYEPFRSVKLLIVNFFTSCFEVERILLYVGMWVCVPLYGDPHAAPFESVFSSTRIIIQRLTHSNA